MAESIYDFECETISGEMQPLSKYKGKALLIVNTASKCGFTPQYDGLEALYEKYAQQGLEVLGFPCNQFGNQEPGTNADIQNFCSTKFDVSFPLFAKVDVNGSGAHPLYKYLKEEAPGLLGTGRVKWNFTKFLVDKNGNVLERFAPKTKPEEIEEAIEKALA
ncbi:MAG: glutathione peroxidase [Pseudomonadales bacterium]